MIFKVLIIIVAVWLIFRLFSNLIKKKIDFISFILWLIVWVGVIVFMIHPTLADQVALMVGIGRGTDVAFFVAFIIMFYFIFRLYAKINVVESDVTETVKYVALINKKLEKNKK
jgi:hypothetical protein